MLMNKPRVSIWKCFLHLAIFLSTRRTYHTCHRSSDLVQEKSQTLYSENNTQKQQQHNYHSQTSDTHQK